MARTAFKEHLKLTLLISLKAELRRLRSTYAALGDIVGIMHDVSSQPKVTDLHDFSLSQEDITSCQVTVHTLDGEKLSCSRTC